jgi:hypothetical protein
MVVYIYNSSTQETEAEGFCVQGQPELCSEMLSQNNKNQKMLYFMDIHTFYKNQNFSNKFFQEKEPGNGVCIH